MDGRELRLHNGTLNDKAECARIASQTLGNEQEMIYIALLCFSELLCFELQCTVLGSACYLAESCALSLNNHHGVSHNS